MLTASRCVVASLWLAAFPAACKEGEPRRQSNRALEAARPGCPAEPLIEALHAAAFHFQHGPSAAARGFLALARSLGPAGKDAVSERIFSRLSEISLRVESDRSWARSETEYVRVELGDWSCLTRSMHRRFHAKLPALPR